MRVIFFFNVAPFFFLVLREVHATWVNVKDTSGRCAKRVFAIADCVSLSVFFYFLFPGFLHVSCCQCVFEHRCIFRVSSHTSKRLLWRFFQSPPCSIFFSSFSLRQVVGVKAHIFELLPSVRACHFFVVCHLRSRPSLFPFFSHHFFFSLTTHPCGCFGRVYGATTDEFYYQLFMTTGATLHSKPCASQLRRP